MTLTVVYKSLKHWVALQIPFSCIISQSSIKQNLTSSIFLWMSCSWSSHSCISESKLSISSGLSCPQPRPLCSSPRSRSMAAMTQAAQYTEASLNCNFPFLLFHFPVRGHRRVEGSMAWKHYKDKHMVKKEGTQTSLKYKTNPNFRHFFTTLVNPFQNKTYYCSAVVMTSSEPTFIPLPVSCYFSLLLKLLVRLDTFCPHIRQICTALSFRILVQNPHVSLPKHMWTRMLHDSIASVWTCGHFDLQTTSVCLETREETLNLIRI